MHCCGGKGNELINQWISFLSHKFGGLKQHRSPSQFWEPEIQNQAHWVKIKIVAPGTLSLRRYGRACTHFSRLRVTARVPWLVAASLLCLLLCMLSSCSYESPYESPFC